MRYWWVNHKQTARHEIGGEYLWSPRSESGEHGPKRSQFYDNMREASPGDLVLSYANGAVRYIGRVTDFAFPSLKPIEFGATGAYWSNQGWYLPVFWTPLARAVRPKPILDRLGPLLPERYSPISATTGNGNQKAYLAEVPQGVVDLILSQTNHDQRALQSGGANSLNYRIINEQLEDRIEQWISDDRTLDDTTREYVVAARRGQGEFRRNVRQIERVCRLTGIDNPALLIASHIKPWRVCETAPERLDGMNGLFLTPDADFLFDRGFITFEPDGEVRTSQRIPDDDLRRLGFETLCRERFGMSDAPALWNAGEFRPRQQDYLAYHRERVFVQ